MSDLIPPIRLFSRWLQPSPVAAPLPAPPVVVSGPPAPPPAPTLPSQGRSQPVLSLPMTAGAALPLPARSPQAPTGSAFLKQVEGLDFNQREAAIAQEILRGNVPDHLRNYRELTVTAKGSQGQKLEGTLQVLPDYLAIGSNDDYVLIPMTPLTAQQIADRTGSFLPTRKVVDEIYRQADVKLKPSPKPPGAKMMSTAYYREHDATVRQQREQAGAQPGQLIAGHKKDVVLTNRLQQKPNRVAIYGWHQPNGKAIQPLSTIHEDTYSDYSHGVRLMAPTMRVNGVERLLSEVLSDPALAPLLSDEGPLKRLSAGR